MKHIIITRMHYEDNNPRFDWRLAHYQACVLPRILKQTKKDFDIGIWCNPNHAERIKKLSNKIITFSVKGQTSRYKVSGGRRYFEDFTPWKDVMNLEKYDVQTGLDSDDLIAPNYIEKIEEIIENNSNGKSLHITFQPMIFDFRDLEVYQIGVNYNTHKGSMFFSIYQPDKQNYKFAYEYSHLELGKHFNKSIIIPKGFCWLTVHYANESSKGKHKK